MVGEPVDIFDAADPWYKNLVSWSEWLHRWLLTSLRSRHRLANCYNFRWDRERFTFTWNSKQLWGIRYKIFLVSLVWNMSRSHTWKCGLEVQCFWHSPDWSQKEFETPITPTSTKKLYVNIGDRTARFCLEQPVTDRAANNFFSLERTYVLPRHHLGQTKQIVVRHHQ